MKNSNNNATNSDTPDSNNSWRYAMSCFLLVVPISLTIVRLTMGQEIISMIFKGLASGIVVTIPAFLVLLCVPPRLRQLTVSISCLIYVIITMGALTQPNESNWIKDWFNFKISDTISWIVIGWLYIASVLPIFEGKLRSSGSESEES